MQDIIIIILIPIVIALTIAGIVLVIIGIMDGIKYLKDDKVIRSYEKEIKMLRKELDKNGIMD